MSKEGDLLDQRELFGHPTGLYTLFFAEMWERFSYYGMRALLLLYLIKGFLGYGDKDANAVYGAYTALVYMTPFFGGMIADKLLGARTSVVIGGILMAAGHLLMTIENGFMFFTALALLIAGNGFFKPNISTIVGSLYPAGSPKRDGGFTIFYIGINLGAAMAPLLCGYVGETYGWHYGFGLATIGMLVGLAVFVAPTMITQGMILTTAIASGVGLLFFNAGDVYSIVLNVLVAGALVVSGVAAVMALSKGGLPGWAGMCPKPEAFGKNLVMVLIGTAIVIPIFVLLVSGFSVLPSIDNGISIISEETIKPMAESENKLIKGLSTFIEEAGRPAGLVLIVAGLGASIYLLMQAFKMDKIARERMFVVFVLTFFSLLFWAFFEQSGSSVNNFTDRNVSRVMGGDEVGSDKVGTSETFSLLAATNDDDLKELNYLSQEFLGHENGSNEWAGTLERAIRWTENKKEEHKKKSEAEIAEIVKEVTDQKLLTMTALTYFREYAKSEEANVADKQIVWKYTEGNVGKIKTGGNEIPASVFQSVNPIYIMIFGLVFTVLWGILGECRIRTKYAGQIRARPDSTWRRIRHALLWSNPQRW